MKNLSTKITLMLCSLLLLAACQSEKEDLKELNLESVANAGSGLSSASSEEALPEIKFVDRKKGGYRIVIKDPKADSTQTMKLTLSCCESLSLNFEPIKITYKTIVPVGGDNPFIGQVVNVGMSNFDSKGNEVSHRNFDVFVFEDGTTAVQKPIFGAVIGLNNTKNEKVVALALSLSNDPAQDVAAVEVLFEKALGEGVSAGPYYLKPRNRGDHMGNYNFTVEIEGIHSFPQGVGATCTMLNAKGEKVGEPITTSLVIQKADFTGRIKRIRIRENNSGTNFRTVVLVEGDDNDQVAYVEMRMEALGGGAQPVNPKFFADLKRTDAEKSFFVFKDLAFEGGAKPIEIKYTMTAQMKAADGSNLGGEFSETIDADFTGRIRRIRIRERRGGSSYRIIADENTDPEDEPAAYVEVIFNDTYGNPAPVPATAILTLASSDPEEMQNRYVFSMLTFKDGAKPTGLYNITATMLRADGSPIEGTSLTQDIVIEDNIMKAAAPVSSQIVSYDMGKSWWMIVKYKNPEPWVEGVEVAFTAPFEESLLKKLLN